MKQIKTEIEKRWNRKITIQKKNDTKKENIEKKLQKNYKNSW